MNATIEAWQRHAAQRLRTTPHHPTPAPDHLYWTPIDDGSGPGAEILGPLAGRTVLDLGCGPGHHLAHLVAHHSVAGTGIDAASNQTQRASLFYGHLPVAFHAADARTFLLAPGAPFDVIYSIFGAVGLTTPEHLLPAVAARLRPGGRLVFAVPHPDRAGATNTTSSAPRHGALPLFTTPGVQRWDIPPDAWRHHLVHAGLDVADIDHLTGPNDLHHVSALLVRASKPPHGG